MKRALWAAAGCCVVLAVEAEPYYLVVAGLGGEPRYAHAFDEQANAFAEAARRTTGDDELVTVLSGEDATRESLQQAFNDLTASMSAADTLVLFLIGHGSFDGEQYKFNLRGPDVSGQELGEMLAGIPARSQLIVNATSASGAVLEAWAADGRTLVTATRSGAERNATRFAEHWTAALSNAEADIDKNGTITVQEAFDYASRKVAESYESESTLATEHPQLAGDAAPRFAVARLTERSTATPELERLISQLTELEGEIDALRLRRDEMESEAYLNELQGLLLQLARMQQEIDAVEGGSEPEVERAEGGSEPEVEGAEGGLDQESTGVNQAIETGRVDPPF